ncbi:hypothetical protein AB2L57_09610 [Microbacterium sp. HA-8]|uniref:hypothetical protein n=1 Tax=Microbacterium sp. HA-8 TaxID=3234200 RepID=UPI0038F6F7A0
MREQMTAEFIELVQAIFDPRNEGIVGPRWRRWFSLLCDAVAAYFGSDATLLHLLAVASDPALVKKLALRVAKTDRDLGLRLHNEVGSLSGDEASNLPAWAISKFQPLVGQRRMREILGRPRDAVDVTRLIDEGGTLLVDLAGSALGTGSARMLGSLWLLKHWVAMGRRADQSRPHVIIVDEAHLMTFGALPAMLAEARKFGIGVVVVSQSIESLSPALQSAIEANVGTFFSYRLGLNTAGRASARFEGWPAQELVRLPDLRAATTLTRGGLQTEPFLLTTTRPAIDDADAYAQAAAVDARCAATWSSLAGQTVSDADVASALASPQTPRPEATVSVPSDTGRPSFLQDWLTARVSHSAGHDSPVDSSSH